MYLTPMYEQEMTLGLFQHWDWGNGKRYNGTMGKIQNQTQSRSHQIITIYNHPQKSPHIPEDLSITILLHSTFFPLLLTLPFESGSSPLRFFHGTFPTL